MKFRLPGYLIGLMLLLSAPWAGAEVPFIIDAHAHLNKGGPSAPDFEGGVAAAIGRMDQHGIREIILMPPPMPPGRRGAYELDQLHFAVKKYPGRVLLGGGGGSLNAMIQETPADAVTDEIKQRFREQAEAIAAAGAVEFGEIAAHHLSLRRMGPNHAYEYSPPDHPLLLLLADIAAEKGLPIDLHLDLVPEDMDLPARPIFNPTTPAHLKGNLAAFERLLDHNPKARIIWAHAGTDPLGTRVPKIQRELLKRHPNLYMSVRVSAGGPPPFFALDPSLALKPEWLALLRDFPDRFVLGSDFFHAAEGAQRGPDEKGLENFRTLLRQLPPDLAAAIAHGNAEKLFHLPHG